MRFLGIDFGLRRIGLALSDVTGTLATPLSTLTYRTGKRPPLPEVASIVREHSVQCVVMGLPLDLKGEETDLCAQVRAFGNALAARLTVPVEYVDERMTSVRAQRALLSSGVPRRERAKKERVDAVAAAFILQAWLDGPGRR